MNEVIARIVAHLMGDGCVTSRYMRYNNTNEYLLEQFKTNMTQEFGKNIHFIDGTVNSGTRFTQIQNKEILEKLFEIAKSYKSGEIEVPTKVMNADIEVKKAFIRALFDDEGSVKLSVCQKNGKIKRDVHMCSKSKRIIKQIKKILENELKIKCNKIGKDLRKRNNKKYITWILRITGEKISACSIH
jgi:intein/homing endonuclease